MNGRRPRAIGYALLAAGLVAILLSAVMSGALSATGNTDDARGYDATRLAIFLGLLWIAPAARCFNRARM
jgi:hypothetical protein